MTYLTNYLHIYLSIYLSVRPSVHPSIRPSIHPSIHPSIYLSMALQPFIGHWPLLIFLILYTVGRTPWTGFSPSKGRYLHTEQHKHRTNAHIYINALIRFRTHDPSVRASEDSSCPRTLGHCNWHTFINNTKLQHS
jgi:hypothetical protein